MHRYHPLITRLLTASLVTVVFLSCNSGGDIPFPEKDYAYAQPVSAPLHFSAEKKIKWDTVSQTVIKPSVRKMDIDALPAARFDSTGFNPLSGTAVVTKFNMDNLPEKPLNLDKLSSTPFEFTTSLLPAPAILKTTAPARKKGNPLSIYDLGSGQGLPAKFVTSLLKDKDGLLWIGSGEGIFRYNGEYAQMIVPPPFVQAPMGMAEDNNGNIWFIDVGRIGMINLKKGTISYSTQFGTIQNNICRIIKDDNGLLWLAKSNDKQVKIIDPAALSFKNFDSANGLIVHNGIALDILQDNKKNIWITTTRAGVQIINPKEGKIKYLDKANGLFSDTTWTITQDNSGKIWMTYRPGAVNEIDPETGIIKRFDNSMGFDVALSPYITSDNKGKIWIGRNNGMEVFDPSNNTLRFIDQSLGLAGNYVSAILEDDFKRMWVASTTGLNMIEQHAETVHPYNAQVTSIMEDAANNLWLATPKGSVIINLQKQVIHYLDEAQGLSNNFVQSFTNLNGNIIVATNGGYNIVDPVRKTIEITSKKEGLVSDTIYNVFKDKSGNTWLVGPAYGVTFIDSVKKLILHLDAQGGLSDNNIQDIRQDDEGLIWIATNNNGVDIIDLDKGTIRYLTEAPGLKDTCNRMMIQDKQGRMWIGTDKGVYVADLRQNLITGFTTNEGLSNNRVLSLSEYNGNIIAGTNRQVTMITPPEITKKGWELSIVKNSEGLVRENGNTWATDGVTSKGAYLWGDVDLTILHDIKAPTDSATTFITGMTIMTRSQNFVNDLSANEKDTLWANDTFYLHGQKPLKTGYASDNGYTWDSVSGPYNMPVNLKLPHTQNYIQFQFAQAHLGRLDNTSYSYILEGIDKNWSAVTDKSNTENYLNLPPGNYTFKVCSRSLNGKWGSPAVLSFTIMPPWWATWWAYTLYLLFGIAVLRGYIVFRSRKLQRENKLLEEKVNLRTNQLQQSIEDLKATQAQLIQSEKMASLGELTAGIAHEIQNPLNFVNNFSDINKELLAELKEEIDKGNIELAKSITNDVIDNEEKIIHHGRRADSIVKSMLQHTRSSSGQKEPTDLNQLTDEYLRLSYHGLRAKDKSFNADFKTDFDKGLSGGEAGNGKINIVPQDIGRVLLNLFNNAFYAVNEKKKQVNNNFHPLITVTTRNRNSKAIITVSDNGNGIPQKVTDKIFQPFFTTKPTGEGTGLGLSLSYDIIKAHGGEIKVETKEGEGTTFIIELPVN